MIKKAKTIIHKWIDSSPSTRKPSLIKYHIQQIGLFNYLRGNYYTDDYYSYSDNLETAYRNLANLLVKYIVGKSLIDIGCGSGLLLHLITQKQLLREYVGLDFKENPTHISYANIRQNYRYFDLAKSNADDTNICMETAISVEVLEHIHRKKMDKVIQNIQKMVQNRLILSVAKPGQWGDGHITCMPKSWWIGKISKLSFSFNRSLTQELNEAVKHNEVIVKEMSWILGNFLIFDKE